MTDTKLSDTDKLLIILRRENGWISQTAILDWCRTDFGHGMTVHSRVSDLRKRGHIIANRLERTNGRVISYYRLVT